MEHKLSTLLSDQEIPARHRLAVALICTLIKSTFWGSILAGLLFGTSWLLAIAFGMTIGIILIGTLCLILQEIIKDPKNTIDVNPKGFWSSFTNDVMMKLVWAIVAIAVYFLWQKIPLADDNILEFISDIVANKNNIKPE